MEGWMDGWDDAGAAKVGKECWAKFRLLGPTSALHSPSQQLNSRQGEAEPLSKALQEGRVFRPLRAETHRSPRGLRISAQPHNYCSVVLPVNRYPVENQNHD